jgi:glutamine phosphoribosylpyrophosphate amidotransferase
MCAVIGALLRSPTTDQLDKVRNVFLESRIRGMHATGLSYVKNGKVVTLKEAVPASVFSPLSNMEQLLNEDGNLYLIGHCRYSTSDLRYNQPMQINDKVSIVHNGVISQELPENWEELYGYRTQTQNDSELINHTLDAGLNPLTEWADSSMAIIELHSDGLMNWYRNGKRPLYKTTLDNGLIITSTKDIVKRAGITIEPNRVSYAGRDLQPVI